MTNNVKTIVLSIVLFCVQIPFTYGQRPIVKTDTAYIILLQGTLSNKRPISGYLIAFSKDSLQNLQAIKKRDAFVCNLYKEFILFEEPAFTLQKNLKFYEFSDKEIEENFLNQLSSKIEKLSKSYLKIGTKKFCEGTDINILCAKVIGEFWQIVKKPDEINTYNHSFEIEKECYDKNFVYNLKDILKIESMTKKNISQLKLLFGLNK